MKGKLCELMPAIRRQIFLARVVDKGRCVFRVKMGHEMSWVLDWVLYHVFRCCLRHWWRNFIAPLMGMMPDVHRDRMPCPEGDWASGQDSGVRPFWLQSSHLSLEMMLLYQSVCFCPAVLTCCLSLIQQACSNLQSLKMMSKEHTRLKLIH